MKPQLEVKKPVWIPVKNEEVLKANGIFEKIKKLYNWSHINRFPGLFSRPEKCRDLYIDVTRYFEIMEQGRKAA